MSDSSRQDSQRTPGHRSDGFKKRNGHRSSSKPHRGGKNYGDDQHGDRRAPGRRYNNENRPVGGHKRGGQKRRAARENAAASSSKSGYRPSHGRAPELDTDVTGKELDFGTQKELRALEKDNAELVAKHLVMAGRYLDIDPQFALQHAQYAVSRAGRISAVREAAGIAAYVAEDFDTSLKELRTHRRISGSNEHLALLIDSERALGRTTKALELAAESRELELKTAERVEIAMVVSGIRRDQGDLKGALIALEIPELNSKRGYEYSPRLFGAYADLLVEAGREKEAERWLRLARMTEAALGQGDFAEPEIFDIYGESELFEPEEAAVDLEVEELQNQEADSADAEVDSTEESEKTQKETEEA